MLFVVSFRIFRFILVNCIHFQPVLVSVYTYLLFLSIMSRLHRCCRCNRTGTCRNCSCKKSGNPCVCCLPGELGYCANSSSAVSASQPLPSTVTSTLSPVDVSNATPTSTSHLAIGSFPFPSLDSIFELKLPTLQHVPKGARDAWAALLSSVCSAIARDPTDLVLWSKIFHAS